MYRHSMSVLTVISAIVIASLVAPMAPGTAAAYAGRAEKNESAIVATPTARTAMADGQAAKKTKLFININSKKCLTIAGGSKKKLAPSVQFKCDGHKSRKWIVKGNIKKSFLLVNANSNLCLTINGGSRANSAPAVQFTCDKHPSRRWRVVNTPGKGVQVRNLHSKKCLTIAGGRRTDNAAVVQFNCDKHPSRRWRVS